MEIRNMQIPSSDLNCFKILFEVKSPINFYCEIGKKFELLLYIDEIEIEITK